MNHCHSDNQHLLLDGRLRESIPLRQFESNKALKLSKLREMLIWADHLP